MIKKHSHFSDSQKLKEVILALEKRIGSYDALHKKIIKIIASFYNSLKTENELVPKLIVGLSGGVDSSVVAFLAVQTVGPKNVIVIGMPRDNQDEALEKFNLVAESLKIPKRNKFIIPISPIIKREVALINKYGNIKINTGSGNMDEMDKMRIGNLSSRARVAILYDIQRKLNGRVLGTGNRTEYVQGYAAKYGTPISYDFGVLDELYKTDIYNLAKMMGVPEKIINAKPTTGYFKGQTHEEELGATLQEQDAVAYLLFERRLSPKIIKKKFGVSADFIGVMQNRFANSAHKRMLKQPRIRLGLIKNDRL